MKAHENGASAMLTFSREDRIDVLIRGMTPGEKLGQLTQIFSGMTREETDWTDVAAEVRSGAVGSFIWALQDPVLRNEIQREAVEHSRLGIPLLFGMDIIHGARTVFPIGLGLSCSFAPELFERMQRIAAEESLAMGLNWIFAPMCDLARDPRWGRVAESCGEDPWLSAICNAAQVVGLQGVSSESGRIAACLKHFVGYSTVLGGRDYNEAEVSDWTLRNLHFPSFHSGIRHGAMTVMSGFNSLGGVPMAANRPMLDGVLRGEWCFSGFVVSDWQAIEELVTWGFARDRGEASELALRAGNDVDMLTRAYRETLEDAVRNGRIEQDVIDEAVRRVLCVKTELGLFEQPYVTERSSPVDLTQDKRAFARECATESVVLLKNDSVLPLSAGVRKIALIGPFADDPDEMLGCWAEWGRREDVVTLVEGLRRALPRRVRLRVVKGCTVTAAQKTQTLQDGRVLADGTDTGHELLELAEAVEAAGEAEVVILAIGEARSWTGENGTRASLGLTGRQQELFDAVARLNKPLVSIVFSGRPLSLPEVWRRSAAVLYAWQPGIEGGAALADLLLGVRSPSGRLSMSVLKDIAQAPLTYNHPKTGRPGQGQAREGSLAQAAFWFGFGLTYTRFSYRNICLLPGSPAQVACTIENTGERPGVETVQLYVRQICCREGVRPQQELRGVQKIPLNPGESTEVRFALTDEALGYWTRDGQWRVDPGSYLLWIAPSALTGEPLSYEHPPGVRSPAKLRGRKRHADQRFAAQ